ncbi:MAG: GIY-YIG nuclease family protein [Rickettsiales bacterium]
MRYTQIAVYILASGRAGTLYVGVTSNLTKRIYEHRTHAVDGFTKKYHVTQLVYFEMCETMDAAIVREKRLKKYLRQQKIKLIEAKNPQWNDLWSEIVS